MTTLSALSDMRGQLDRLVRRGFVSEAGPRQLREFPRYLAAIDRRRAQLEAQLGLDRQLMDQIGDLQQAFLNRPAALPAGRPPGESLRQVLWTLEEIRVSLGALRPRPAQPGRPHPTPQAPPPP